MSELLENFSLEDLIIPTVEQDSLTVSLPDLELDMDLDFDISDFPADLSSDIPTDGIDFSTPSVGLSLPSDSDFDFDFDSDTGLFNSGLGFNSFGSTNTNQFAAPPMMMPMPMPMFQYPYPNFGYQAPPGYMLVPAPVFYDQQSMMPMMQPPMPMPMDSSFSFTPTSDAPAFPSFDDLSGFDTLPNYEDLPSLDDFQLEPEPISAPSPTPSRTSRRTAGKKTTYKDPSTPTTPARRRKTSYPQPHRPAFELNAPISVLTESSDIPVKDMLAVASRSVDIRRAEATARSGKISRSLNSFVCYRAAYADRIRQHLSKTDYQAVSIIAGASWKLEPESVRKFYINCADIDKANHFEAFPDYKYAPTKKPARSDTRKTDNDDESTSRPNKRRHHTPLFSDDEDDHIFVTSAAPTPSKYNLRRRH